jgi:hypothetical protein
MERHTVDSPQRLAMSEPVERLVVSLIAGQLNVVATDGPPLVEVTRSGRKPVVVDLADGVLTVRQERGRWPGFFWWLGQFGRRFRTDVSVAVPRDTRCDLHLGSGGIVATGLRVDTKLVTVSGGITLQGLAGRTFAKTISGPVEALGVGGDLTVEVTSGEITLAHSNPRQVYAKAVSGSVTCDLDNPRDSEIRLETVSGEITVRVREDSDLAVRLEATSGRVSSGFHELRPDNRPGRHGAYGTLGAGTGRLHASAVSGNVALLARSVDPKE